MRLGYWSALWQFFITEFMSCPQPIPFKCIERFGGSGLIKCLTRTQTRSRVVQALLEAFSPFYSLYELYSRN